MTQKIVTRRKGRRKRMHTLTMVTTMKMVIGRRGRGDGMRFRKRRKTAENKNRSANSYKNQSLSRRLTVSSQMPKRHLMTVLLLKMFVIFMPTSSYCSKHLIPRIVTTQLHPKIRVEHISREVKRPISRISELSKVIQRASKKSKTIWIQQVWLP
jgi:hypothetical protein